MNQRQRTRTIAQLRNGTVKILVATDVAARGIDVQAISHVINYDLPETAEDYVHRIGRTGRAGAKGIALSFVTGRDAYKVKKIEKFTAQEIAIEVIAGLEPTGKKQDTEQKPRKRARPQRKEGAYQRIHEKKKPAKKRSSPRKRQKNR